MNVHTLVVCSNDITTSSTLDATVSCLSSDIFAKKTHNPIKTDFLLPRNKSIKVFLSLEMSLKVVVVPFLKRV